MLLAALLLLAGAAAAQQIGTAVPEVHPKLPTKLCTLAGGCRIQQTSVVADALSRSLHAVGRPDVPCSVANGTQCPDAAACARACALEGADYDALGIATAGDALTLRLFDRGGNGTRALSPRVYLVAADDRNYAMLRLVHQELAYDVDVSKAGCGVNGALYLTEMDAAGGRDAAANPAGAQYGTGYCDAQCFRTPFINGRANLDNAGACCSEMDIWEANRAATAMTPHPCAGQGLVRCTGDDCGPTPGAGTNASTNASSYGGGSHLGSADRRHAQHANSGVCDKSGCAANPYHAGARSFYGPGGAVDTRQPFTVVTQFVSSDNTSAGALVALRRLYVQNGRVVSSAIRSATNGSATANATAAATTMVAALAPGLGTLTDDACRAQGGATADFARLGGLRGMGEALGRGMVLIMSVWDAADDSMAWLDSGSAGPCAATQGDPATIAAHNADAAVTFSNIRWGDIGATVRVLPDGRALLANGAASDAATASSASAGTDAGADAGCTAKQSSGAAAVLGVAALPLAVLSSLAPLVGCLLV